MGWRTWWNLQGLLTTFLLKCSTGVLQQRALAAVRFHWLHTHGHREPPTQQTPSLAAAAPGSGEPWSGPVLHYFLVWLRGGRPPFGGVGLVSIRVAFTACVAAQLGCCLHNTTRVQVGPQRWLVLWSHAVDQGLALLESVGLVCRIALHLEPWLRLTTVSQCWWPARCGGCFCPCFWLDQLWRGRRRSSLSELVHCRTAPPPMVL